MSKISMAASATANTFDDNLESDVVGTAPDNWNNVGNVTETVSNTPPVATLDGSKCIFLDRTGNPGTTFTHSNTYNLSGISCWEFLILKINTDTRNIIRIKNGGTTLCQVRFNSDAEFEFDESGTWRDAVPYSANTWYRVRIMFNTTGTDSFSVWVDNVIVANQITAANSGNAQSMDFSVDTNNTNDIYLDDIEVYTHKKWIGGDSNSWNTGSNWSDGSVPVAGSTVRITDQSPQAYNPVLDATATITALQIDDDNYGLSTRGQLDLNTQTLTVTGAIDIDAGGTLAISAGTLNATGTGSTTDLNGTLTFSTGTFDIDGTFDGTGSTITFTSTGTLKLGGTVTSLGTDANFTEGTGTVVYDANANQTVRDVTYYNLTIDDGALGTATLENSTIDVLNNVLINDSDADLAANAAQTINIGGDWTNNGDFIESTSTVVFNSTTKSQVITTSGAGDIDFYNFTATNTGGSVRVDSSSSLVIASGGTLTITDSSILDVDGTYTLTANNASLTFGGSATGRLKLSGTVTSNDLVADTGGVLTEGSGTIEYDNTAAAQTVDDETFYNLEIDNSGQTATAAGNIAVGNNFTVSSGTFATGSSTVTVTGATDINAALGISTGIFDANGSFDATGGSISFSSNGTMRVFANPASFGTFNKGTGTVIFDGTGSQTLPAVNYYNVTINKSAGTASAGGSFTISNNLTVTLGTFKPNANTLTIDGAVDNDATIDLDTGTSIVTAGSLDNSGTLDTGTGSGKFTVNGAAVNSGTFDLSGSGTLEFKGTITDSSGSVTTGGGLLKFSSGSAAGSMVGETNGNGLDIEFSVSGTSVEFTTSKFDTLVFAPGTWLVSDTHNNVADAYRFYAGSTVDWNAPSVYPTANDDDITIVQGTVELSSTKQCDTLTVQSTFKMVSGSVLQLDETLEIQSGGTMITTGATKPQITEVGAGTGYTVRFLSGSYVTIAGLVIDNPDGANNPNDYGLQVQSGASINTINSVDFQNGGVGTKYLRIQVTGGSYDFELCSFDANCAKNVSSASTGISITMSGATGAKGASPNGEANDHNDTDANDDAPSVISWTYFKTWTGATNTDWDTNTNWNPNGKPTSADSVIIPAAGNNPTLAAIASEASCKTLRLTGGTLSLSSKVLNLYGNLSVESGTLTANTGTIAMRGAINQTVTTNSQNLYKFQINKTGGTVSVTSALTITNNFDLIGGIFDPGTFTHTVNGNWTETGGTTFLPSAGTFQFNGTSNITAATGNCFYNLTVTAGNSATAQSALCVTGSFTLGASATFTPGSYTHTITGNFDVRQGTFNASAGTVVLNGTSPTIDVHATNTDLFNLTVSVSGTIAMGGSSGALDINGAFTLSSGTFNPGSLSHTVAGNWDDSAGTFTPGAGTITLDGGSATVKVGTNNYFNHLTANSSGTKSLDSASAALDVNGNFTLGAGTFDPGSVNIEVAGNWDDSTGTFTPTGGTVTFNGSVAQTVKPAAANNFYNVAVQNSAGVNLDATNNDLDVNGQLELTVGALNANSNLDQLEVAGNLVKTGGSFTTGTATVTLDGTDTQTVPTLTINTFNINKASGTVALTGDVTVNANLVMGATYSSTLNLGTRTLNVLGNLTVNSGNTLEMIGACTLALGNGSSVSITGTYKASGVTPAVTRYSTGNYGWTFNSGATIDIAQLTFAYVNSSGMTISNGNNITALNSISFQNTVSGGKFLRITSFTGSFNKTFSGHTYDSSFGLGVGKNISATSGGQTVTITMSAFGGAGGGSSYEEEAGSPVAAINWQTTKTWVGGWSKRKQLTVNTQDAVASGYTVKMTLDTTGADFRDDANDLRIVYYNGSSYIEIARHVINPNTASTQIWFKLQTALNSSTSDTNYYMYYANASASDPNFDYNEVYDFYDTFNNLTNWTEFGTVTESVSSSVLTIQDSSEGEGFYLSNAKGLRDTSQNFLVRARARQSRATDAFHGIGWYMNTGTSARYGMWAESRGGSNDFAIEEWSNGTTDVENAGNDLITPSDAVWYEYEARVKGSSFTINRDDSANSVTATDSTYTSGRVWLGLQNTANFGSWDWLYIRLLVDNEPTISVGSVQDTAGDWSDPYNWSPIGVPTSSQDVVINGSYNNAPNVDAAAVAASLSVGSSATSSITFGANLTVSSNISIGAFGTMNGAGSTATITLGGDWNRNASGTWTPGTTTVKFNGTPQVISAETWYNLTIDGNVTTSTNQTIQNDLLVEDNRTLEYISGTHTIGNKVTLDAGSNFNLGSSTVTVSGVTLINSSSTLDLDSSTYTANSLVNNQGTIKFGTGILDANGIFDSTSGALNFENTTGTLKLGGSITSFGSSFTATNGTVNVDGTAAQSMPGATFYNLTISNNHASGVMLTGDVTVTNNLVISGVTDLDTHNLTTENATNSSTLDLGTGTFTVNNSYTDSGSLTAGAGSTFALASAASTTLLQETINTINLSSTSYAECSECTFTTVTVDATSWLVSDTHAGAANDYRFFGSMNWNTPATYDTTITDAVTIETGTVTLDASETVASLAVKGTYLASANTLDVTGAVTGQSGGVIDLREATTLKVGSFTLNSGSTFQTSGTSKPTITKSSAVYAFTVNSGATINVNGLIFDSPGSNGFNVKSGATVTDIDRVVFQNGNPASTKYLKIEITAAQTYDFSGCSFDNNCLNNVSVPSGGSITITMTDAAGSKGQDPQGEANDDDPDEPTGDINWVYSVEWIGGTVGFETDWDMDTNWNPNIVPGPNTVVAITDKPNDPVINIATAQCKSINVSNGVLNLNGNTLEVNGDMTVGASATLTHSNGTVTFKGGANQNANIAKTLYNLTINKTGGALTALAALDIDNNFTITAGTFNPGSFTHTVGGNWDDTGGTFAATAGTVTLDSTDAATIKTKAGNNFFNLNENMSGATLSMAGGSTGVDVNGTFTITAGTFDFGSLTHTVTGNWDTSAAGATITAGTSTITFDGGSATIYVKSSNNTLNNVAVNSTATKSMHASSTGMDINGTFTLTAGTFSPGSLTHTVAGNIDISAGTFTPSAGTIELDGGNATVKNKSGNNFFNLNINTTGTKSMTGSVGIDVNGTYTITTGTFDFGSLTHTVAGNWDTSAAGAIITPGTSTVTLDGANATVKVKGSNNSFNNLTVSTSGTKSMAADSTGLDVNGTLTISTGTWDPGSLTHTVAGNWDDFGATAFTGGTGTIEIDGASASTLKTKTGHSFNHLTLNKGAGATTVSMASGSNGLDVNGALTITQGTFNPGSLSHTVAGNFTASAANGNFTGGSSTFTLDGTSTQTLNLRSGNKFFNLTVNTTSVANVDGTNNDLDVDGNFTISQGVVNANSNLDQLTVGGNWDGSGGSLTVGTSTVTFDGSSAQTIGDEVFYKLGCANTSTSTSVTVGVNGTVTVNNTTTVSDGILEVLTGRTLTCSENLTVNAGSELRLSGTGILKIANSKAVSISGKFSASGSTPKITTSGTVGTHSYSFTVNSGGTVDISNLTFESSANTGMALNAGTIISKIDNVSFQSLVGAGRVALDIKENGIASNTTYSFNGCAFDSTCDTNVRIVNNAAAALVIYMSQATGANAGESFDSEPGTDDLISWTTLITWQGDDGTNPTFWSTNANWDLNRQPTTGDTVVIPSSLSNYPVLNSAVPATVTITQMSLASGSSLTMNVDGKTLALEGGLTISGGTLSLTSASTLQVGGNLTLNSGTFNLGNSGAILKIGGGSTLNVNGGTFQSTASGTVQAASGNYAFTVNSGTLNITDLKVRDTNANGLDIKNGVTYTAFAKIDFRNSAGGAGSKHMQISDNDLAMSLTDFYFDNTAAINIALTGNGTASGETVLNVEFIDVATNGDLAGESFDSDDDADADGVAENPATNGALVNWTDNSSAFGGTISGFPAAAIDWLNFSYYSTYVAVNDYNGALDDKIIVLDGAGNEDYSYVVANANGNIVSGFIFNTFNEQTENYDYDGDGTIENAKVYIVMFGTSTGKVYMLVDDTVGGSLALPGAGSAWNTAFSSATVTEVTSPLLADNSSVYFGGLDNTAAPRIFGIALKGGSAKTLTMNLSAASTVRTYPAIYPGGTSYLFVGADKSGSNALIYRVDATNKVHDKSNNTATNHVRVPLIYDLNNLYGGDDAGYMHGISMFSANFTNATDWPYNTGFGDAIRGGAYVDPFNDKIYFSTLGGRVYYMHADATVHSGWPVQPGGSTAMSSGGLLLGNTFYIGNENGKVFYINATTGALLNTLNFGASIKVGDISYQFNTNKLMIPLETGELHYANP